MSFSELLLIGIISLVVLGPEKLPETIRTVSLWIGRLRRSFNTIKQDIEKEIGADEIRRQLRNEEIMEKFRHTQSQVKNSISSIQKETEEFKKNIDLESQVASFTGSAQYAPGNPDSAAAQANSSAASTDTPAASESKSLPEQPAPAENAEQADKSK